MLVASVTSISNFRINAALNETQQQYNRAGEESAPALKRIFSDRKRNEHSRKPIFPRAEAERTRAEDNLLQAEMERNRAEGNLALALDALEEVFERIAPTQPEVREQLDDMLTPDQQLTVDDQDVDLLIAMLRFYDEYSNQNQSNFDLQVESARANKRVGDIQRDLGAFGEADVAYHRAQLLYRRTRQRLPDRVPTLG